MDNIDGRKIPDPVREQIRFEAIENWLAGMTPTRLAHIGTWLLYVMQRLQSTSLYSG